MEDVVWFLPAVLDTDLGVLTRFLRVGQVCVRLDGQVVEQGGDLCTNIFPFGAAPSAPIVVKGSAATWGGTAAASIAAVATVLAGPGQGFRQKVRPEMLANGGPDSPASLDSMVGWLVWAVEAFILLQRSLQTSQLHRDGCT